MSIYLVNGIKLQGHIESFDQYVVLLRNTVTQMVYKHAISTVVPGRAVNFHARSRSEPDAVEQRRAARALSFHHDSTASTRWTRRARGAGRRRPRPRLVLRRHAGRTGAAGRSRPATSRSRASSRAARRPTPALFVGSGKADEIKALVQTHEAQRRDLRPGAVAGAAAQPGAPPGRAGGRPHRADPGHLRGQRAQSHEGKLQVELARLQYLATRLVRRWTHLERQTRRHRHARRPGRDADRARPPHDRRAHQDA